MANYTSNNHAKGTTSNACKWDPQDLKIQINLYFESDEGKEYPTKVGLFAFIKLHDTTYQSWKERNSSPYCKSLLKEMAKADAKIKVHHLRRLLGNPENSKWYLERAFHKEFNLTKVERLEIDNLNKEQNTNIKIILNNKGKNKIE